MIIVCLNSMTRISLMAGGRALRMCKYYYYYLTQEAESLAR